MRKTLLMIALLAAGKLVAQDQGLTPEKLWQLERVHSERVSPDGKQVIYAQTAYDMAANKGATRWIKMSVDGGAAVELAPASWGISNVVWHPSGTKLGFLSAESGSQQWWEMNPDGSDKKQISNYPFDLANCQYSPDGQRLAFSFETKSNMSVAERFPDVSRSTGKVYDDLMHRHWNQWADDMVQHIGMARIEGGQMQDDYADLLRGEPFDAPIMPFGGAEQFSWSPDSKYIVYSCKKMTGAAFAQSTNSELYRYELSTGATEVLTEGRMGYDNEPVFSPDGKWLAWLSMDRDGFESDRSEVWIMHLESRQRNDISAQLDKGFGSLVWAADGKSLFAISSTEATHQVFRIALKYSGTNQVAFAGITQLTSGVHDINGIQLAGGSLVGTKNSMSQPAELYRWDAKSGAETALTTANASKLKSVKMGRVEKRMVKTTDGKDMLTWVIYPPDFDATKKYPALLYCQGGPQSTVSQFFSYRWNFQAMAAQGYIVVAPNRRGLPGFGQEWNDAISKDWGGQAMRDYLSAIDAVSAEPFVDKNRLGAVGASYGGYSVYYLAGIHEGRFKCFISHSGLFNLESWYGSTEELFFANWDVGGPYWNPELADDYARNSPHRMVDKWTAPMLVIHNELDYRVPINQGLEAFTAAKLKGLPARLLMFPDEGHWVTKPQNSLHWQHEFFRWLDEWLK